MAVSLYLSLSLSLSLALTCPCLCLCSRPSHCPYTCNCPCTWPCCCICLYPGHWPCLCPCGRVNVIGAGVLPRSQGNHRDTGNVMSVSGSHATFTRNQPSNATSHLLSQTRMRGKAQRDVRPLGRNSDHACISPFVDQSSPPC